VTWKQRNELHSIIGTDDFWSYSPFVTITKRKERQASCPLFVIYFLISSAIALGNITHKTLRTDEKTALRKEKYERKTLDLYANTDALYQKTTKTPK
jgi:hypothetical protein